MQERGVHPLEDTCAGWGRAGGLCRGRGGTGRGLPAWAWRLEREPGGAQVGNRQWRAKLTPSVMGTSAEESARLALQSGLCVAIGGGVITRLECRRDRAIAFVGEEGFCLLKLKPSQTALARADLRVCVVSSGNRITRSWKLSSVTCQRDPEPLSKAPYTPCLSSPTTRSVRWESSHRQVRVTPSHTLSEEPMPLGQALWAQRAKKDWHATALSPPTFLINI